MRKPRCPTRSRRPRDLPRPGRGASRLPASPPDAVARPWARSTQLSHPLGVPGPGEVVVGEDGRDVREVSRSDTGGVGHDVSLAPGTGRLARAARGGGAVDGRAVETRNPRSAGAATWGRASSG